MQKLTAFLYERRFQDAQLAQQLALLELPNLLALLAWAEGALLPEEVIDLAGGVEELLAPLGRPQALALAIIAREEAARRLGEWSHAQFEAVRISIDRLLEQGKLPAAYTAAQQLLQRALAAGAEAYPEAAYDIALAHLRFGRMLKVSGAAEARRQAIESYSSYRRAGGASQSNGAELYALVMHAIQQGMTTELEQQLTELSKENLPSSSMALLSKLQAILRGDRNRTLADDPDLYYRDAVELLLEGLSA